MKKILSSLYVILYIKIHKCMSYIHEKKDIKKKKNLINKVKLTKEQINEIDELWKKNYGKKISKKWHRLYTSYTGSFNAKYFPEIFFTTNLLQKLNPPVRTKYINDKVITNYLFSDIKNENYRIINSYIYNCSGYFYDNNDVITYEEAISKINNIGKAIIKPIVDSSSGKNVRLIDLKHGKDIISGEKIEEIIQEYDKNFIIQEKIEQNSVYAKLNPSSVNTIRINTYLCDGKVYCAPIAMRIGRAGKVVDNSHAGGIAVGVDENGNLKKYAFTEYGEKFEEHPDTHIKFENYHLPKFNEIVEFAKKYHYRLPHMGIVAWDLALDKDDKIIVIEANLTTPSLWFPQYATGEAFFGENTEKMIRMLKDK